MGIGTTHRDFYYYSHAASTQRHTPTKTAGLIDRRFTHYAEVNTASSAVATDGRRPSTIRSARNWASPDVMRSRAVTDQSSQTVQQAEINLDGLVAMKATADPCDSTRLSRH